MLLEFERTPLLLHSSALIRLILTLAERTLYWLSWYYYRNQPVSLRVHLITLSNHRQAWDMSLGLLAFADGDSDKFYSFASLLYENQHQFYNGAFTHKTHMQLQELIAELAHQHAGVDKAGFLTRMSDSDIYTQGRTPIRYAATRGVWATPTLFINNGGNVPVDHTSSLKDWQKVIDSLLSA